jgi:glycosyltransferase involved in cell wall biosynthesis
MNENSAPRLTVVIPVYNEEKWITPCVDALMVSAKAARWTVEVVVVDDGSTDATAEKLVELASRHGITVLTQTNKGRFEARRAGLAKASGDQILLLDSRVIVDPDSLMFLRSQLIDHSARSVWNGHINVASKQNPYAGFMAGLVKIPWRRYFANPQLMSFGSEEFDLFPKGTGFFSAPRQILEEASDSFTSLYEDAHFASDDTGVLRWIVQRQRIFIAPEFSATYHGRETLKKFMSQSYFRGTTFVDSYLANPGPARNALFGGLAAGLVGLGFAVKKPKTALVIGAAGSMAAGAAVKRFGASKEESAAVARLTPLFATGFGAGLVRGLFFALKAKNRQRRSRK